MTDDPARVMSGVRAAVEAATDEDYARTWKRIGRALNEMAAHFVATVFVLLSIKAIEILLGYLAHGDLVFFKNAGPFELHGQWLFDAGDVGVLVVMTVRLVLSFHRIFGGRQ